MIEPRMCLQAARPAGECFTVQGRDVDIDMTLPSGPARTVHPVLRDSPVRVLGTPLLPKEAKGGLTPLPSVLGWVHLRHEDPRCPVGRHGDEGSEWQTQLGPFRLGRVSSG